MYDNQTMEDWRQEKNLKVVKEQEQIKCACSPIKLLSLYPVN